MAAPASTLTPQQQEARKGRITSTRIVRLVNGKVWDVWADMMGLAAPVQDNQRMRFGRKLVQRPGMRGSSQHGGDGSGRRRRCEQP